MTDKHTSSIRFEQTLYHNAGATVLANALYNDRITVRHQLKNS
ncbi:MAG: hypothetical protein ACSHX0_01820 [Akkermansiaceae bacterium]